MRQKINATILLIALFSASGNLFANDKSVGLIVGYPSGVSFKYWFDQLFFSKNQEAIDIAVGASGMSDIPLFMKADYLVHHYDLFPIEPGKLPLYYGIGIRVVASTNSDVGIRVPVGVNYIFEEDPFDAFFEVAPTLVMTPAIKPTFGTALGFRYRFK